MFLAVNISVDVIAFPEGFIPKFNKLQNRLQAMVSRVLDITMGSESYYKVHKHTWIWSIKYSDKE